jgi:hypothetical protein
MRFTFSSMIVIFTYAFALPAQAQMCEGVVKGLSATYDPAAGTGFLAVRTKPRGSAPQINELHTGDRVEITDHRKGWFFVNTQKTPMVEGWVSRKFIATDCKY